MQPLTAHLSLGAGSTAHLLVVGDLTLLGGVTRPRIGDGGVASGLVMAGLESVHGAVDVDVAWGLRAALRATVNLAATGQLVRYDTIVVILPADEVLRVHRRLADLLSPRRTAIMDGPAIVVVLTSEDPAGRASTEAVSIVHGIVRPLGIDDRLAVLPALAARGGALAEPGHVAPMVLRLRQALKRPPHINPGLQTIGPSDVAVDRSLAALRGRTGDLRRAVTLVQNSFDVPFAQLNLVSRGTLRSLAYVGRSSDGLQQSLSAEAARSARPLLVADTRSGDRFAHIPETRGPDAIRYYVGHPVHDDDGHRIGVLCALDVAPREVLSGDDDLIRDLALLAEGELSVLAASSR